MGMWLLQKTLPSQLVHLRVLLSQSVRLRTLLTIWDPRLRVLQSWHWARLQVRMGMSLLKIWSMTPSLAMSSKVQRMLEGGIDDDMILAEAGGVPGR